MCLCVNNGQNIRCLVFLHNIEWVGIVLRILNIKGYQNCIIGSKVTMILTTYFVNDQLGFGFVFHLFFTESAFTDYEDETFKEISNLRVQRSKFGGKMTNFAFFFYSMDVVGFVYSNSGVA